LELTLSPQAASIFSGSVFSLSSGTIRFSGIENSTIELKSGGELRLRNGLSDLPSLVASAAKLTVLARENGPQILSISF
jgi:hypothetical protein